MLLIYIAREITIVITKVLIMRREAALREKDYHKVWVLDMAINKNKNRTISMY